VVAEVDNLVYRQLPFAFASVVVVVVEDEVVNYSFAVVNEVVVVRPYEVASY